MIQDETWTVAIGPHEQGGIRDALEAQRDENAERHGGYTDDERAQQDAAFGAAETLVDRAEFHGEKVRVTALGHVATRAGQRDSVTVAVIGEARD